MGKVSKGVNNHHDTVGESEEMELVDEENYQCGVLSFRPSVLQCCANMKVFTLVMSMVHIFGNMNFTYYTAVISEIERQFGLSSSVSGFIKNIDNIGYLCAVLFVSHFLRYSSKPKIFAIATVGTSVAIAIFAMPHFIYGVNEVGDIKDPNITLPAKNISKFDLCEISYDNSLEECNTKSLLMPLNVGALMFFVVSELAQGVFQSPKFALSLTYLDDNAKKKSPLYFGILFATRSFSPVLGFLLGAWTTRLYVDLSNPGISRNDPRWVGAWWLGFIICALCSVVWAVPLALFPKQFKEEKKASDEDKKKIEMQPKQPTLKELPKSIWRLLKNPVLMCLITASCFNFYLMGFATFTPKYLQNYFRMSTSTANILTGVVSACSYSLGPIVSGRIMASKSITPSGALKFILVINCVAAVGFTIMGFLGCPEDKWAGDIALSGNLLDAQCNDNCSCDPFMYTPVCGSDGVNYFSPCYAGCTDMGDVVSLDTQRVFSNCTCISDGVATEGMCDKDCLHMLIPYIIVMIISKFSASMTFVPYMTVLMRCVTFSDKALALGFSGSVMMVAAFPAPVLFGMLIDSTCLFKQSSCTRKGACLLYDLDMFRIKHHAFAALVKVGAICMYTVTLILLNQVEKRKKSKEKHNGMHDESAQPMISKESVNNNNYNNNTTYPESKNQTVL